MAPEGVTAGAVLHAVLEPRPGSVLLRSARWAHYLVSEMLGGLLPPPSLTQLVVRRIVDDEVVLSLPAGDLPAGEQLLRYVENQLHELTLEEFMARWSPTNPRPWCRGETAEPWGSGPAA